MSSVRKSPPANSSLRGHGLVWQARDHRFVSQSLVRCLMLEHDLPRSPGGLRALSAYPSCTEDENLLRSLQCAADHLHSLRCSNLAGAFRCMLCMLPRGAIGTKMVNMVLGLGHALTYFSRYGGGMVLFSARKNAVPETPSGGLLWTTKRV